MVSVPPPTNASEPADMTISSFTSAADASAPYPIYVLFAPVVSVSPAFLPMTVLLSPDVSDKPAP